MIVPNSSLFVARDYLTFIKDFMKLKKKKKIFGKLLNFLVWDSFKLSCKY